MPAITLDVLKKLLGQVREGTRYDFKREMQLSADADKNDFCADVVAFALAQGGHILIGAEEGDGETLSAFPGIELTKEYMSQLRQVPSDGVDPPVIGFDVHAVDFGGGKSVVVVRIPNDGQLHRTKRKGEFWVRVASGKQRLNLNEALALSGNGRQAREERGQTLAADRDSLDAAFVDSGFCDVAAPRGLVSLYIASKDGDEPLPLSTLPEGEILDIFQPIYASGWDIRHETDATHTLSPAGQGSRNYAATQLHATGRVFAVSRGPLKPLDKDEARTQVPLESRGYIPGKVLERELVDVIVRYINGLRKLGQVGPWDVAFSLLKIEGFHLAVSPSLMYGSTGKLATDSSVRSSLVTVGAPADWVEIAGKRLLNRPTVAASMRTQFDRIWRAFGYQRSYNFTEAGEFVL
jgi:hypothetical protein